MTHLAWVTQLWTLLRLCNKKCIETQLRSQSTTWQYQILWLFCLPVVVKDSQYEPNSPEDNQPVDVTEYYNGSYQTVEDQQDLTEVKAPALVIDIVE